MASYRSARQHTGLWLLICGLGIAAELLLLVFFQRSGLTDRLNFWVLPIGCLPFIVAALFGWWLMAKFDRKRKSQLEQDLYGLGFEASLHPTSEMKQSFGQPLDRLMRYMGMVKGPEHIQWLALRGEAGNRMFAWEYMYVTGSGKTTNVHEFTALVWPAGHPETAAGVTEMPFCELSRPLWLQRNARRKEEVKVDGLPAKWVAYGDADTARKVMTPALLAVMAESPRGEAWLMGGGWVACVYRGKLDGQNFRLFWWRASEWLSALNQREPGASAR